MYKGKKDLTFWVRSTRDDMAISFKIHVCEEISLGILVVDGRLYYNWYWRLCCTDAYSIPVSIGGLCERTVTFGFIN